MVVQTPGLAVIDKLTETVVPTFAVIVGTVAAICSVIMHVAGIVVAAGSGRTERSENADAAAPTYSSPSPTPTAAAHGYFAPFCGNQRPQLRAVTRWNASFQRRG